MDIFWKVGMDEIKKNLYPVTIPHLLYVIIGTGISLYVTGLFLKYKLIRWIYIGTIIVLTTTLFRQGDKEDAVKNIFKLATI